jgi:predicted metal-dependent hydrolase
MTERSWQLALDDLTNQPQSPVREVSSSGGGDSPSPVVEVRRSARRRRTVSAYRDGDRTIVLIPGRMSRAEERRWVDVMLKRLDGREQRRRPSDEALVTRARQLSERYLQGRAVPDSVRWVSNQVARWGSCTPFDRSIRLSDRLQAFPDWVIDYVLVHELVHLIEATHSDRFWSLVSAYPKAERARGFLEGVTATAESR